MRRALTIAGRLALLLVPLGLGIAILARAVSEREAPVPRERAEPATAVRVITVEPAPFSPQVTAFGTVEPASTWRAAAQVSGEVVRLAPDLRPGRLVEAGTEVVRIDATDYELAEAQAAARLAAAKARLAELGVTRDNLGASLRIERRALDLAETELARHRTLLQRGTSSQTAVDRAEEAMLARRRAVQEIENALKLLPAQIRVQEAEGRIARARLDEARRAIARTVVTMPFDGRIAQVSVEREQFVATGETMLVAEDIGRVEVSARLRLEQLETLVTDRERLAAALDRGTAAIDDALQRLGLRPELALDIGGRRIVWPAEVRRLSFALDAATRTIGLVVGVDEPFGQAVPGERPPLVRDMFVEVRLTGAEREGAILLPREALEREAGGWTVLLADGEDRLRRRDVDVEGMFGNAALIAGGLEAGERVVVGALEPAIEGMRLVPREDAVLKARLAGAGAAP